MLLRNLGVSIYSWKNRALYVTYIKEKPRQTKVLCVTYLGFEHEENTIFLKKRVFPEWSDL